MKKAEDLASEFLERPTTFVIGKGFIEEQDELVALIREDREAVIDACKIAGMKYLDNFDNDVSEGGFQGFFDALDALIRDMDDTGCPNCTQHPQDGKEKEVVVDKIGVHRTHCCKIHGCKYGDDDCPVVLGIVKQDHPCEECGIEKLYTLADLEKAREDTRVKCKEAFIDGYESGHNDTVESRYGCSDELADNWIYDNFGSISSIEERVRRETVEKVIANGTLITQGEPMCEWEVLSIDRETLTAIAEGGE